MKAAFSCGSHVMNTGRSEVKLRIYVADFQGKARRLAQALASEGHQLVDTPRADVALLDFDGPWAYHRPVVIEHCVDHGGIVVIYPHGGGTPMTVYDGLSAPDMRVAAHLAQAPGEVEIFRRMEFPLPVHVVGWFYCELRPFTPSASPRHVLFAPQHPLGDGATYDPDIETNRLIYRQLLQIDVDLTVQMVGSWEQNGLWPEARVRHVASDMYLAHTEVDKADVVIAVSTLAYVAVARGKPVVLSSETRPVDATGGRTVRNWGRYGEFARYPFTFDVDGEKGNLANLIAAACAGGRDLESWKELFIGQPLCPRKLSALIVGLYAARNG